MMIIFSSFLGYKFLEFFPSYLTFDVKRNKNMFYNFLFYVLSQLSLNYVVKWHLDNGNLIRLLKNFVIFVKYFKLQKYVLCNCNHLQNFI